MLTKYSFSLRGEDHTEFVYDVEAHDSRDAYTKIEYLYPEATILSCHDEKELAEIANRQYLDACRRMDDEDVYDERDY